MISTPVLAVILMQIFVLKSLITTDLSALMGFINLAGFSLVDKPFLMMLLVVNACKAGMLRKCSISFLHHPVIEEISLE